MHTLERIITTMTPATREAWHAIERWIAERQGRPAPEVTL